MPEIKLHSDWPAVDFNHAYYGHSAPLSDLAQAFESGQQLSATPIPGPVDRPVPFVNLAEIIRYYVAYGGDVWTPGDHGATELQMVIVAKTIDDRWVAVEAWNDFTGWGCQDGSDIRVGATEDQVIRYGLTADGRGRLGYTDPSRDPKAGA